MTSTNSLGQQLRNKLDMKYEIEKQQNCGKTALRLLKQIGLHPLILGGAPRDWLHDRPAKDLDIYIQIEPYQFMSVIEKIEEALYLEPYEIQDITSQSDYLRNKDNGVLHVLNILNLAVPMQIILCDREPMKMLELFHGSLSQAFADITILDGSLVVKGSKVFELGKRFNTHFIKKGDDLRYIQKVADKYPDYHIAFEV